MFSKIGLQNGLAILRRKHTTSSEKSLQIFTNQWSSTSNKLVICASNVRLWQGCAMDMKGTQIFHIVDLFSWIWHWWSIQLISWAPIRITDIYICFFWFLDLRLDIDGWIFFFCDPNFSDMKSTTWDGNIAHQIKGLTIRVKRLYMSWTRTPRNMNHDLQCFHPRNPFLTNEVFLYKYLFIFLMFNGFMDVESHLAL